MRATIAIVVAALGASAHASYDLMFIPTTGTNAQVKRYDPANFASLGSVGPQISPVATAASLASGRLAVSTGAGLTCILDYSTGAMERQIYTYGSWLAFNGSGNTVIGATPGGAWTYDLNTNATMTFSLGSISNVISLTALDSNHFCVVGVSSANHLMFNTYTVGVSGITYTYDATIVSPALQFGVGAFVPSRSEVIGLYRNGTSLFYYRAYVNGSGSINSLGMGGIADPFASSSIPSVVPAHAGFYAIGQDSSGSSVRVAMYSNLVPFSVLGGSTYSGTWTSGFQPSIVLAPEPASLAALGLGALALLRGRRQRR